MSGLLEGELRMIKRELKGIIQEYDHYTEWSIRLGQFIYDLGIDEDKIKMIEYALDQMDASFIIAYERANRALKVLEVILSRTDVRTPDAEQ